MVTATMRMLEVLGTMPGAIQRRMRTVCVLAFLLTEGRAVRHLEPVRLHQTCDPLVSADGLHPEVIWGTAVETRSYHAGTSCVGLLKGRGQTRCLLERTWETRVPGTCGRQALAASIKAANPGEAADDSYVLKAVAGFGAGSAPVFRVECYAAL